MDYIEVIQSTGVIAALAMLLMGSFSLKKQLKQLLLK